jgi:hypothetical protein
VSRARSARPAGHLLLTLSRWMPPHHPALHTPPPPHSPPPPPPATSLAFAALTFNRDNNFGADVYSTGAALFSVSMCIFQVRCD